jgi:hypothetical protein
MATRRLAGLLAGSLLLWAAADASAQGLPPWLEQWQQPATPEPPRPRRPTQPQPPLPPGTVIQPPPTIPSVPLPTPIEMPITKPAQLFEFKLGTDVVEEYSDNFFLASVQPITNFRTLLVPRGILLLHGAFLEGVFQTALNTAWDSSVDQYSFFPSAGGQITAEVTPRWILGLSTSFTQTDNPAATNRLGIQSQRNKSTGFTAGATSNYAFTPLVLRQSYMFNRFQETEGSTTTGHTAGGGASLTLARINTLSLDYTYTLNESKSEGGGDQDTNGTGTSSTSGGGGSQKTTNEGHGFVLGLSREVSARLVGGASANFAWRTTKASGAAQDSSTTSTSTSQGGTTTTDFTRWGAGIFGTYTLPDTLIFRGSLGFINLNGSGGVNETVLSTQTSMTYFSGPLTLDASLESGFSETFQGNSSNFGVVKTQSVSVGAGYAFTPKITARVGGSYRRNEETGLGGGGTAGNKTTVASVTGGVSWQALPWLAVILDYTYTNSETLDGDSSTTGTGGGAGGTTGTGTGAASATGYQENRARISFKFDF